MQQGMAELHGLILFPMGKIIKSMLQLGQMCINGTNLDKGRNETF
tara:strand:- start:408 stop:542 length:135 start_codon:yes stop_codon:yes gene_type:complete